MPRRRRINSNFPPNLYASKKGTRYYDRYRHPVTGKETGMGIDKAAAIKAANELNARLSPAPVDLVSRVVGGGVRRMDGWLDEYWKIFLERVKDDDLSNASVISRKSHVKRIREQFGKRELSELQHDVLAVANFIKSISDEGKRRMAQQIRTALIDVFSEGIRGGVVANNPAAIVRNPKVTVTRSRLTLENFQAVLGQAANFAPWVSNVLLLGVVTGQRRTGLANMQFRHVNGNWLQVEQHKTGTKVRLSLDIKLGAIGLTIGDLVSRCRDRVVSRHLIHHTRNTAKAKAGSQVDVSSISREFARARDKADLTWEGTPPSFHEIRSLSARLYAKQGLDAQSLLGHSDPATTRKYMDSKGVE